MWKSHLLQRFTGFAETATGLGHCVADRWVRPVTCIRQWRCAGGGGERHRDISRRHCTPPPTSSKPTDAALFHLDAPGTEVPLVLVDDEISTGATALRR